MSIMGKPVCIEVKNYILSLLSLASERRSLEAVSESIKVLGLFFAELSKQRSDTKKSKVLEHLRSATLNTQEEFIISIADELELHDLVKVFLLSLVRNGDITVLPEILMAWDLEYFRYKGYLRLELISAIKLDEKYIKRVLDIFKSKFGDKIYVVTQIEPKIIGGLVIRFDDQVYDDSLLTKMDQIQHNLKRKVYE